ncbi:MAG: hypothetical protein IIA23_08490 [Chloroflexi bacterium]|nr:hypothetical protein [Chloroflexota bacterium]
MVAAGPSARATVLRSLLLFTPFLLVVLVALTLLLRSTADEGASGGRIVALVLVGLVALLLVYQVVQSVRDLFSRTVETIGRVERRWSRSNLLRFRNGYIVVERNVFRLPLDRFAEVDLGDTVRIVHYPHTATVEAIEVVARKGASDGSL